MVLAVAGAAGGFEALDVDEVLEREGDAVEGADAVAGGNRLGGGVGGLAGGVVEHDLEGGDPGFEAGDVGERRVDEAGRGLRALAEGGGMCGDGLVGQVGHMGCSVGPFGDLFEATGAPWRGGVN